MEGENITVSNLSFCDKGNDTYEYNISVGDTYWTGWQPLGERPIPATGGGGIVINEFFTGGTDCVEFYNYGPDQDMSGWVWYWHDERNYEGKYDIPKGFTLKSQSFRSF